MSIVLPGGILREDLLKLLCRAEDYALTLLLAPAGSGKSTLLAQWQAHHAARAVVHYPVQARDDDPVRFFRRLLERIRAQVADFDLSWFNPFGSEMPLSPVVVGEYLADALERIDDGLFIVLDDFQHVSQLAILDVLASLLERLPPSVRVIISSRNQPGISLSRLKLENRLLSIDRHDLRMSAAQIRQLNTHLGGPALTDAYIDSLLAMTEGWVTGIKMALLACARFGTIALERFNGSQPEIVDYFGHVVLKKLSPSLRDFFLCSAIFEKFNGDICDRVLERSGSALLLEDISARELFMLPVDNQPGWYRYHALLHDLLSNRLAIEKHGLIGDLHARAARYYAEHGEYDQALHHAQLSADIPLFGSLLEKGCDAWIRSGQFSEILRWVEPLPESEALANSRLIVPLIGALTLSRRFHQARYYLDAVRDQEARGAGIVNAATLQFLTLNLQLFQHDTLGEEGKALLEPGMPREVRGPALAIVAYHDLMNARVESSIRFAVQAKDLLAQSGHSFLESYADLIIALCRRNSGRATSARKEVSLDYERTDKSSPAWVNRATAMVVALYEQNQLAEAQQLCEDLIAVVNSSSATEAIVTVYITLSRLLHRRQLHVRASRLLDQLSSILQLGSYARFVSQVAQESLRQAYVSGKSSAMEVVAQRYRIPELIDEGYWESTRRYDECWERYGLAAVYWLMARGAHGRAQRILKVLAESLRQSEVRARGVVVEANLLVLNAQEQGKDAQLLALRRLVEEYGIVNISRSVFDEAPGFGEGMLALLQSGLLEIPEKYQEFYGEFLVAERPPQRDRLNVSAVLTGKENQIVDYLLGGLSNSEISARMGIALSTTKWHLKNIYSKLDVSGRTDAILYLHARRQA